MLQATRTLVKSAPELWAEVADPDALEAHLAPFGALSIEDVEAERLVRWRAEHASGTFELEPAGFGTRVRARAEATTIAEGPAPESAPVPEPPKRGFWARVTGRAAKPEPVAAPASVRVPSLADDQVLAVLRATLESLGTAHHRPFSRA